MLLELQQRMESELAKKERELAEKNIVYQQLLERYNLKLANEYGKKSEKMPGADEVFNEVELVLDEHDKKLLAKENADATTKIKPKRKPLPATLPRKEVVVDIGLELSRQTMSSWMLRSAQLLEPLYERLKERLLAEPAIQAEYKEINT